MRLGFVMLKRNLVPLQAAALYTRWTRFESTDTKHGWKSCCHVLSSLAVRPEPDHLSLLSNVSGPHAARNPFVDPAG